jgi:hypothetical protein
MRFSGMKRHKGKEHWGGKEGSAPIIFIIRGKRRQLSEEESWKHLFPK